jgi:hypothetical protein
MSSLQTLCPHCHHPCSEPAPGLTVYCPFCQHPLEAGKLVTAPRHKGHHRKRPSSARAVFWARLAIVLSGIVLIAATTGYSALRVGLFGPKLTRTRFDHLKVGMKEADVHRLLGDPRWVDDRAVPRVVQGSYKVDPKNFPRRLFWEERGNVIWVELQGGRVTKRGATLDGEEVGDELSPERVDEPLRMQEGD